jgi:hypothetical protein
MKPGSAAIASSLLALVPACASQARAQAYAPSVDAPLSSRDTSAGEGEVVASQPEEGSTQHRLWSSAAGVTAINATVWSVDRYLLNADWARISLGSWGRNLSHGFVWDEDGFGTNQFAHPYHGGLYYNTARGHWSLP